MTFIEIMNFFTAYGADVVFLAAMTSAITQLLKKKLFKTLEPRYYTFFPFVIGVVLYALYTLVSRYFGCGAINFCDVPARGLYVGTAATAIYVIFEQFVRKNQSAVEIALIVAMIEGFVAEGSKVEVAERIYGEIVLHAENCEQRVTEILAESATEVAHAQLQVLAKIIVKSFESKKAAR